MSETRATYDTTPDARAILDGLVPEDEFQGSLTDLCDVLGLPWYHPNQPRRDNPGFPDLTIADARTGTVYLWELKTMSGRTRERQKVWGAALSKCYRLEYGLYRPCDFTTLRDKLLR